MQEGCVVVRAEEGRGLVVGVDILKVCLMLGKFCARKDVYESRCDYIGINYFYARYP